MYLHPAISSRVQNAGASTRSIWRLAALVFACGHPAMRVGLAGLDICPHFKVEEFWIVNKFGEIAAGFFFRLQY